MGLANVMRRTDRLSGAEALYKAVAATDQNSVEAALGIATIQACGTGEELRIAHAAVEVIIDGTSSLPKARDVMGLMYERSGNIPLASAQFK